jgi:hypothetical protein
MNFKDQKSQVLTAKQRLAVSRQALIVASQQKIWQGMANMAANALLNFLESRKGDHLSANKVPPETSNKSKSSK